MTLEEYEAVKKWLGVAAAKRFAAHLGVKVTVYPPHEGHSEDTWPEFPMWHLGHGPDEDE